MRRRRPTAVVEVAGGRRRGQTPPSTSARRIIPWVISIASTGRRAIVVVWGWVVVMVGMVVGVPGWREVAVVGGRRGRVAHAVSVSLSVAAWSIRPVAKRRRRHRWAAVAGVGGNGAVTVRRGGLLVVMVSWWWWGAASMVDGRQAELEAEVTEDGAHVPTVAADELGDPFV